jgi:hypothetical protein
MADKPRCEAITAKGERCKARARSGSTWCRNHDPALAGERKKYAAAGGHTRSRHRPSETERARRKLWEIVHSVLDGRVEREVAIAATQALNGILRSVEVERRTAAVEELAQRIEALEADEREGHRSWAR